MAKTRPEIINAYQETKTRTEFGSLTGNIVYNAEDVWNLIDMLYDLGQIEKIDFKDLY